MLIGHFTEQPWQHPRFTPAGPAGGTVYGYADLELSNREYDPEVGAQLYNRYIDEKLYAEEVGFEGLMLNEHHTLPACMQGVTNVEACILARQTSKAKIIILGNIIPIWEDPLWLVEQLSMIDMISRGRLVSGWVRGTGRESVTHNANPTYNRERWQEAHDFIMKAWTTPGPFRWEGKHYNYRYVNPWAVPLQKPHPQIWIPGVASRETVIWSAQHHFPYVMLATLLEPTRQYFELYHQTAKEAGYKSGTQNLGYLFKVHVEETEEKADEVGRKYIRGVNNPFQTGNEGRVRPWIQSLPGITSRESLRQSAELFGRAAPVGRGGTDTGQRGYEAQVENLSIISGTPKSVLPKMRKVLETLRPGSIIFWDGDGSMTHDDQMRSLRLHGAEIIPAAKEMGKELGLLSPYEVNDGTGFDQDAWQRVQAARV
jgi:alkanesulfonate monooxygenase SsuD/methylene tetrahydromethanopterin reductase-like flavin-dependent oxidoreductase (luciferase family)